MSIISTPSLLGRPSAVVSRSMSDLERVALGTGQPICVIDPQEIAEEYSRLTLRDRIGARPVQFLGGTLGAINGNPALVFANGDGQFGTVAMQMPPSYFIATVTDIIAGADTSCYLTSTPPTPSALPNRLFFGSMAGAALRLDHGVSQGLQMAGAAGRHVSWGTYQASTGAAQIGFDTVSPGLAGVIAAQHAATATTAVYGGNSSWGISGSCGPMIIADRYLGGDQNYALREAMLAWLAAYGGVSLGT